MDEKKRSFTERDRKDAEGPYMDNPEHLRTDKESIYDMHEDMQTVDAIPMEDARMEWEEEKRHHDTKSNSSTEEKYQGRY
ncbi:hypothetical protein OXB_1134 [Bacillus sp. OxB-1]|uniref:hypothetical protein n=1 Tax=Bacillus sp. (strain OxB-1) TaxID=98228 RepID=UPI000581D98C|nr:hypothetical protein [Bacillus sp. OxB-1]BAQ09606.1 hypothetical protein OXB_1134 [Bacillus sp. OxB-1]